MKVWSDVNVLDLSIYYYQPDQFFLWLPNRLFKIDNKAIASQNDFNEFCLLLAKSNEGREEEGPKPCSVYTQIFYLFSFSKNFARQRITLVKINGIELKLKGRTMNIK